MDKFENVDVLAALNAILNQNTGFYQEQFEQDRQMITEAAASTSRSDKTLLWVSAPAMTQCKKEKDLLIDENVRFSGWGTFAEGVRLDGDKALAYAVELTGNSGGKIMGDLYQLDYLKELSHLHETAVPAAFITITDKDGTPRRFPFQAYKENELRILRRFGPCRSFTYEPKSKVTLARLLRAEHESRELAAHPADLQGHIRQLAADRVADEAQRIVTAFQRLWNPNSGDDHFMVQVSPIFLNLSTSAERKQLTSALPYKSLAVRRRDDFPGLYAFISKDENRDQPVNRLPIHKPSVKKQLQTAKAKAPKREAKTTKQKEKEITL